MHPAYVLPAPAFTGPVMVSGLSFLYIPEIIAFAVRWLMGGCSILMAIMICVIASRTAPDFSRPLSLSSIF